MPAIWFPAAGLQGNPIPPPTSNAKDEANKIIIPQVVFSDVTLREAVDFLNQRAKELAKNGGAVPLVIDPEVDATVRIKEIRFAR